ncbi:MAG: NifU family protein [Ktedonobacteraceae bacterium]|nr:NifU family protein [Ktedonobacteraceae bacterium]
MLQSRQASQQRAARIETLVQEVTRFSDAHARATTEELIQAILDMYGEGLARILELAEQNEHGQALIESFAQDELVASLFLLHGLHPLDVETRIGRALDEVRPYLRSHGGNVTLLRVEDGIAYLRLEGSCHGCPASTVTLKHVIEEAINQAAPDLDGIKVEDATASQPVVSQPAARPVTFVPRKPRDGTQAQKPGALSAPIQ